jgi:glycosyltransferase involved in cell wall biosynthesis
LVKNIGLDHSGTHSIPDSRYAHGDLDPNWLPRKFCPGNYLNEHIQNQFQIFFRIQKSLYASIKSNLMKTDKYFFFQKKYLSSSVLFVNTYERMGGAAIAANRLFQSISAKIEGVRLLTLFKQSQDERVDGISRYSLRGKYSEVYLHLRNLIYLIYPKKQKSFFSINGYSNPFRLTRWRVNPKIVHLHWIGDGILSIAELKKWKCPIVWTLHDVWAFTGGCHYTQGCIRYLNQCGNCPQLGSKASNDVSHKFFMDKMQVYASLNLTIVTPSNWLAQMAKSSILLKNIPIRIIPNGIDMSVFLPKNKKEAREALGIHHDLPIILIGAQSLKDQRKGVDLFIKSLEHIRFRCAILVFGSGDLTPLRDTGFMVHSLGEIDNEAVMVNVYSAANVFVCPSREDNLPNTIIESMSCGTPAVAFEIGGIPEIIDHLRVGWLAIPFDVAQLAKGVEWVINHPEYADLCKKTHQYAFAKFNLGKTTEAYLKLYNQLLNS